MEVELQGQDLKSVIEMEDNLLKQKGEVRFFKQTICLAVTFHIYAIPKYLHNWISFYIGLVSYRLRIRIAFKLR